MTTIHIDFPEDIQQLLKRNEAELADDLKLYGAMPYALRPSRPNLKAAK